MKKILIYILCFISLSTYINAQTTAIPDTAFEQKLLTLGIDSDGLVNGQILNSDAASVLSLNVNYAGISSLIGINAFVNLDTLTCFYNSLTSLDVSNCTMLRRLNCNRNNLTSLNVTNNLLLTQLSCFLNNLTNLDVTNNVDLILLDCAENRINQLDLTNNPDLLQIKCSTNNISNLDVSNNVDLFHLSCNYNNLNNLNLLSNTLLGYLECNYNNLTSLDVSNSPDLTYLHCIRNNLSTLDVSNAALLGNLGCNDNNLSSLDVTDNIALVALNCEYNTLNSLDLTNNTLLRWLYCPGNNLSSLDLTNNTLLEGVHCNNNNLNSLDLSNNTALEHLYLEYNNLVSIDLSNNTVLEGVGCQGNDLVTIDFMNNALIQWSDCRDNRPSLRICLTTAQVLSNTVLILKDPTADISENCYPLSVEGQVVIDDNLNCLKDSSEQGLRGQWIKFAETTSSIVKYVFIDDSLGNYRAYLGTGVYEMTIIPSGPYWESCPDTQMVTINNNNNMVHQRDWTLQPLVSCPALQVDIAAPFLRMTGGGSAYTVSYCNVGSLPAQGAYVEVDIDADLNVLSSTLPIVNQVGTVYSFSLGTVGIGACGSFKIQVVVDTSAQFEQTHCTEAHIYPDSICAPTWTGPRVDGFANCQNSQIDFTVENAGAAMLSPQPYTIFEDNIAMRTGTVNLGSGQSTMLMQTAAPGKTYRIEVDQAPGFPGLLGNLVFSSTIEGCTPFSDGSFNTGFVTQFSNGHSAPFLAIDCQQNIASYDPNDKAAQPAGYGAAHYIAQNIALDYKIRFQNTGTDTAFNIVILDTLSSHLDITSLQMGASSHAYTWSLTGNVLKVSFPNIMLVDSIANEPLSHGFFRYRIAQNTNNPIGTLIENQAAIYFDYNPAIFTNTTFHTVGENFVNATVSVEDIYVEGVSVKVYPNPFEYETTIEVEVANEYERLELNIFDISGRKIETLETSGTNQIKFFREGLEAGIYIYQLKGNGVLLNTGKIAIQ
jgi:hypothetical protein